MRKKVLLSFVGERDPHNASGQEGSLLSLCGEIGPDKAYLLPSAKKTAPVINGRKSETESNAQEVAKILQTKLPHCDVKIYPLEVTDVTDFVQLSTQLEGRVNEIITDLTTPKTPLENYEFHINCSSGAQQMITLGYILASTGRFPGITRWQVKDPRYGGNRIVKILSDVIGENTYIQRIKGNLEQFNFPAIHDDLCFLAKISCGGRQGKILDLAKVIDAYVLMDLLLYKDAYQAIASVKTSPYLNRGLLGEQIAMLDTLQGGTISETPHNLVDLYYNMQRCFRRGVYADVLSRFWRLGEGILYYRLQTTYKIDPRDIWGNNNNAKNMKRLKRIRTQNLNYQKEFMNFEGARKALKKAFKDKACDQWAPRISALTRKRNDTIVAHGMSPVDANAASECLTIVGQMFPALVPNGDKLIKGHPFRPEVIQQIADIL